MERGTPRIVADWLGARDTPIPRVNSGVAAGVFLAVELLVLLVLHAFLSSTLQLLAAFGSVAAAGALLVSCVALVNVALVMAGSDSAARAFVRRWGMLSPPSARAALLAALTVATYGALAHSGVLPPETLSAPSLDVLAMAAVIVPVLEEVAFRLCVLELALCRLPHRPRTAVLASAVLFAVAHWPNMGQWLRDGRAAYGVAVLASSGVFGACAASEVVRSRRFWGAALMHVANNAAAAHFSPDALFVSPVAAAVTLGWQAVLAAVTVWSMRACDAESRT